MFFLVGHIFSESLCVFNELFVVRYTHLKFTSFPVLFLFIGFPHPPLRGPPSPKGRPTDTEAIYREVVGEGSASRRPERNLMFDKVNLDIIPFSFEE